MQKNFFAYLIPLATLLLMAGCNHPELANQAEANHIKPQVIHHVFFWLKDPDNAEHLLQLKEGLKTLARIPEVKKLYLGVPASTELRDVVDNSYQVSELMFFDSAADQDAYQAHPVHLSFVEKYSHLWEKVVVYDMLVE